MSAEKPPAGLYILSTPIGAANDVTLHVLDLLARLDLLVAEDTRVLCKLMDIHGVALNGRRLQSYHDHSSDADRTRIMDAIENGAAVGYASDAGTPLIADPGYALINDAYARGLRVEIAPGASALTAALALAGQPTDKVYFGGFLPVKSKARKDALEEVGKLRATLVFYESPKRMDACLGDMNDVFGPDRSITLCRELTKKFQEVRKLSLSEMRDFLGTKERVKGEVVLVLGPPSKIAVDLESIKEKLIKLVEEYGTKEASVILSRDTGLKRKQVYDFALSLKDRI
ncbi:MAG: 16S rRNA (cytidine(1402)-2'-O)-methyltransferase [Pseudomonadota bacterium]